MKTIDYGEILIEDSKHGNGSKDYFETEFGKWNERNTMWHKIPEVKKIIHNGLNQKILFENGEINLSVKNGWLRIYSTNYDNPAKGAVFSKELIEGYSPVIALFNAKNSILNSIEKKYDLQRNAIENEFQKKAQQRRVIDKARNDENIRDISFYLAMNKINELKIAT